MWGVMLPRKVYVEVESTLGFNNLIELLIKGHGYTLIERAESLAILEKGSRVLTYIGFTNWNYVHRRLKISLSDKKEKYYLYRFEYEFSWLTNIAYLYRPVFKELSNLAKGGVVRMKKTK
jgi:hypothetical protein